MLPNSAMVLNRFEEIRKFFPKTKIGLTKTDLVKDSATLNSCDLIFTTPEAWDILTRRWKVRKGFNQIGLFVVDNLHMISENYSIM